MAGTYVRDATAIDLVTGATLNAAGTTNGNINEVNYPGWFGVELSAATATGTTPTLDIEVLASDSATFANTAALPTVSLGRFGRATAVSTKRMKFYTNKRYVRSSVVLGGTTPSFAGSTLKIVPPFDRFQFDTTA